MLISKFKFKFKFHSRFSDAAGVFTRRRGPSSLLHGHLENAAPEPFVVNDTDVA